MSLSDAPTSMLATGLDRPMPPVWADPASSVANFDTLAMASNPYSNIIMSKCGTNLCGRCAAYMYGGKYTCPVCRRLFRPGMNVTDCVCGSRIIRCKEQYVCGYTDAMPKGPPDDVI